MSMFSLMYGLYTEAFRKVRVNGVGVTVKPWCLYFCIEICVVEVPIQRGSFLSCFRSFIRLFAL